MPRMTCPTTPVWWWREKAEPRGMSEAGGHGALNDAHDAHSPRPCSPEMATLPWLRLQAAVTKRSAAFSLRPRRGRLETLILTERVSQSQQKTNEAVQVGSQKSSSNHGKPGGQSCVGPHDAVCSSQTRAEAVYRLLHIWFSSSSVGCDHSRTGGNKRRRVLDFAPEAATWTRKVCRRSHHQLGPRRANVGLSRYPSGLSHATGVQLEEVLAAALLGLGRKVVWCGSRQTARDRPGRLRSCSRGRCKRASYQVAPAAHPNLNLRYYKSRHHPPSALVRLSCLSISSSVGRTQNWT
ncbi:hypothetical protein VTI74DRAFT_2012 [Chaetomium olivicolor]